MILFCLLILVMPLASHPLWGRFVGGFTVVKYLGAACLLSAVIHLALRKRAPRIFASPQAGLFLLLYLAVTASYFAFSLRGPSWEVSPLLSYSSFLALLFITAAVVDSPQRLRAVVLAVIASCALASLYALREWWKFHLLYRDYRPGWMMGDSNYFAISTLLGIPLAFCLLLEGRDRAERWFCLGALAIMFPASILSASRGGFLGLLAALFWVIWHSKRRARNLAVAAILLMPLLLLTPSSPMRRLVHPNYSDDEAVSNRTTVWKAARAMIAAHPVAGIGLGNFKTLVTRYETTGTPVISIAHNSYLEIGSELGLPGLALFVAILWFSLRSYARARRNALRQGSAFLYGSSLGLEAGLLGCCLAIGFVSGQYQKLFWLAVFLSVSMSQFQDRGTQACPRP